MPMVQEQNPGLQELVFACFGLPFGLALIVICGGECARLQEYVVWTVKAVI